MRKMKDSGLPHGLQKTSCLCGLSIPLALANETGSETGSETGNETAKRILEILKAHPDSTYVDLSKAIGKSRATLARHMKDLVDRRVILRIGPQKGGHWEVLP